MNNLQKEFSWVLHYRYTSSTMTEAKSIINDIELPPDNFIIVTDEQSEGVGRRDKIWYSPLGGLWFTFCIRDKDMTPQVTLMLGLCLYETLTDMYPTLKDSLQIKWPNDLLIDGKKLAGILVEKKAEYMIAGIGINSNNLNIPINTMLKPTNLKSQLSFKVSNHAILSCFVNRFHDMIGSFRSNGIAQFKNTINNHLWKVGQNIAFDTDNGIVSGICMGINQDGALQIKLDSGQVVSFITGSINST